MPGRFGESRLVSQTDAYCLPILSLLFDFDDLSLAILNILVLPLLASNTEKMVDRQLYSHHRFQQPLTAAVEGFDVGDFKAVAIHVENHDPRIP